jgi:ribosomal protein L24E
MRCQHCEAEFDAKTSRRLFCSAKCRKLAWQRRRGDDLAVVEEQLTRALTRVRALRGSG